MGDLMAAWFPLSGRATKAAERFEEKGLDVMRLQAARFGALHVLPNAMDAARVHGVVSESSFFQQVLKSTTVERVIKHLRQAGTDLGLIAIADCLNQEIA